MGAVCGLKMLLFPQIGLCSSLACLVVRAPWRGLLSKAKIQSLRSSLEMFDKDSATTKYFMLGYTFFLQFTVCTGDQTVGEKNTALGQEREEKK